jgi:hypothetical protein
MPYSHTPADLVVSIFCQDAQRRLKSLLAEHGASEPGEVPVGVQKEILRRAAVEAVAANFPAVNPDVVDHSFRSFLHPAFLPALERMKLATRGASDAFELTRGVHAAVVLAGFGLPVAPFDLARASILGKPSNDIDTVLQLFSRDKGACVGYSTCAAPFYLLLTDCLRTFRELVTEHPDLSEVRSLIARVSGPFPSDPGQQFVHGITMLVRQPGDTISTVVLYDPDPLGGGSIALYAEWEVDGQPFGAPNEGYLPVPLQLLRKVVNDQRAQVFLSRAVCAPPAVH